MGSDVGSLERTRVVDLIEEWGSSLDDDLKEWLVVLVKRAKVGTSRNILEDSSRKMSKIRGLEK